MSVNQYIDAFANYLRSGNASKMALFCENPAHLKRLAVYRNGFYKSCIDALVANFPMCHESVGNDVFRKIARLYVDHFPPVQGTLVGYGQDFPGFIADFIADNAAEENAVKQTPYGQDTMQQAVKNLSLNLVDIAHLDYAWLRSLMSANSNKIVSTEYITNLVERGHDISQLKVKLNASVLLLRVSEGAFAEWISLKTNNNEAVNTASPVVNFIMLWRLHGAVQARSLLSEELAFMQALQGEGKSLEDAFNAAIVVNKNFAVSDAFSACLQNELIETELT